MLTIRQKILRAFAFTFLGVLLPGLAALLLDVSRTGDWTAARVAGTSLVLAAASAAVRALVAYLPILPDDTVGLQKK